MLQNLLKPIALLFVSNAFMNMAWYGHLKSLKDKPLYVAIFVSWLWAFMEYCFQVPANRLGSEHLSLEQLKITQEVITMIVFSVFSVWYMKTPITWNYLWASMCLIGAVYFIFRN